MGEKGNATGVVGRAREGHGEVRKAIQGWRRQGRGWTWKAK